MTDSDESLRPAADVGPARRLAAAGAIVCGGGIVAVVALMLVDAWPVALLAVVALGVTVSAAVRVVVAEGWRRRLAVAVLVLGAVVLVASLVTIAADRPGGALAFLALGLVGAPLGVYAQRGYVRAGSAPELSGPVRVVERRQSVLFLNPMSGGGKVGQFDLVEEARSRGVETVVLGPDDDLTALAEGAVADGAEVLGMAGGDGSQADVAAVAVAHDLPFVCVPAGTRNHFALDLNLDRDDPRLALDAFVEGVEHRVDHGLAGGRFFVNNVSLGIYPHVVQDPDYRDGRLKAAASIIPELMDPATPSLDLRFASPSGERYDTAQVLLVSNNPYRGFAALDGAGRRVSLTGGVLGVLVIAAADPDQLARASRAVALGRSIERIEGFDQWTAPSLRIESADAHVLAGVDGEAMDLPTPLDITIVPRGLRVIVPLGTPAAPEPTARLLSVQALGNLLEIAGGVAVGPYGDDL